MCTVGNVDVNTMTLFSAMQYTDIMCVCVCVCVYVQTGLVEALFSDTEKLALLVACFCHDLDHRGTNNAFQSK